MPWEANQRLSTLRQTSPWSIGVTWCGGVELVARVDQVEALRLVGLEQALVERAREEVVVDPEEHVALRVALGQERPVDRLAGVAPLQDLELQSALLARTPPSPPSGSRTSRG